MPTRGVRVEGAKELRAALKQAADAGLIKELAQANKSAAEVVAARALPKVPVRTGRLRASVRALGSQRLGQVRAGSGSVPYAAAIHWGRKVGNVWHGKIAPNPIRGRPFLTDAADESLHETVAVYDREIGELMRRIER